ncbi:hypothetical protein, partial [Chitinophaga sp.]|uniref:hypothetical protein n=1 Tax=Chitinophaga sp. TaxID=1869181 RepID=UPI002BD48A53
KFSLKEIIASHLLSTIPAPLERLAMVDLIISIQPDQPLWCHTPSAWLMEPVMLGVFLRATVLHNLPAVSHLKRA